MLPTVWLYVNFSKSSLVLSQRIHLGVVKNLGRLPVPSFGKPSKIIALVSLVLKEERGTPEQAGSGPALANAHIMSGYRD